MKKGPRPDCELRLHHGSHRGDFIFRNGLGPIPETDNIYDTRNLKNGEPPFRIETAERVSGEERHLYLFDSI
jgi:hypothetical protein